jgi:hypothetical protein
MFSFSRKRGVLTKIWLMGKSLSRKIDQLFSLLFYFRKYKHKFTVPLNINKELYGIRVAQPRGFP